MFVAALRFGRWLIPFVCERLDARANHLAERELLIERRMNKRLEHVEIELDLFREATMRLINRMAEISASDPVLLEVAKMLRKAPRPTMGLDELAAKLNAMPANGGKS